VRITHAVPRAAGVVALVVSLFLAACGGGSSGSSTTISASGGTAKLGKLQITNAIVRLTVNDVSSMYFTVQNSGPADKLVAASSDVSADMMLHQEVTQGNTSSMVMVDSIAIPANSTVDLIANHYHVMMTGLKSPLKEGDRVTATLTFQNAGKVTLTVPVVSYTSTP
jgi:copper(I)-binding protein